MSNPRAKSSIKQYIVKKSVGVILYDKSGKNVLLVQKRHSYAYTDFVMGKYHKNNRRSLLTRVNNMTIHEKLLLRSLNFEMMWYHLFLTSEKTPLYYRCLAKFTNSFLSKNIKFFKSILSGSTRSIDLMWEPPKGRISSDESNLSCAIRELKEETGISLNSYQIVKGEKVKKAIIIDKIKYVIYYYVARCKDDVRPTYNMNNPIQAIEISGAKWIPVKDLGSSNYTMINDIKQAVISKYKIISKIKRDLDHNTVIDVLN
jgi:ADP-ribose pyrophosphatase YjhB (NUDIX family)